jgi:thioredoxin 1|tara:strand:+ start:175 stop:420 length:246 start_codon:yes stop_codon:yes gene_type:complete
MKKILYFSASWCGPCKTLGPIIESLGNKINYEKIDVDNDNELSVKHSVRNIPTLVLLENGSEKNRLVGLQTEQQILNFYNG